MSRLDRWRGNIGPRETVIVYSSSVPSLGFIRSPCERPVFGLHAAVIAVGVFVLFMLLLCIVRTPHTFMLCLMSIWVYHAKSDSGSIDLDAN